MYAMLKSRLFSWKTNKRSVGLVSHQPTTLLPDAFYGLTWRCRLQRKRSASHFIAYEEIYAFSSYLTSGRDSLCFRFGVVTGDPKRVTFQQLQGHIKSRLERFSSPGRVLVSRQSNNKLIISV